MNWIDKFTRARREPGLIAVGIDAGAIRFAHVSHSGGKRPSLVRWAAVEFADEPDFQRIARDRGLTRCECTTLLAPAEYQMMLVEAPNVPREELRAAIRWRIKDLLDYHVDDATVDVLEVPADGGGTAKARSMYALAAPNDIVQKRIALFESAGVDLRVIDVPEMAQRNVAALFEQAEGATALLSFGEWGGLLTLSARGELLLARRLEVTVGQLARTEHHAHYFERVTTELKRSLDMFERQYQPAQVSELLLAPLPEPTGLEAHLAANVYVPVRQINLAEALEFGDGPVPSATEAWQFFHLIGAALRVEEKAL